MRARFVDGFWHGLVVAAVIGTVALLFVNPDHRAEAPGVAVAALAGER